MKELKTWPSSPIEQPHLLLRQPESVLAEADGEPVIVLRGPVHCVAKHEPTKDYGEWLPPEFYLWELRDLDLDDPQEVLEFVNEWGPVELDHMGLHFLSHTAHTSEINEARARFKAIRGSHLLSAQELLPVAEVRFVLTRLRQAIEAFMANSGVLTSSRLDLGSAVDLVNSGLFPFTPRIVIGDRDAAQAVLPHLYNVICLDIINDIIQGSDFRTCERCRRVFIRQRGRAKYDRHKRRGELKYCSARCSNAAMAKAYRDREKAKGGETG